MHFITKNISFHYILLLQQAPETLILPKKDTEFRLSAEKLCLHAQFLTTFQIFCVFIVQPIRFHERQYRNHSPDLPEPS